MKKHIDHLGIAVTNLEEKIKTYEKVLDLTGESIEEIKDQKVRLGMIPLQMSNLELLESTDDDGPIAKFIAKRGEGFHHLAIRVENIEEELNRLQKAGIQLIDKKWKKGAHNSKIAFIHPKSMGGVLVELVEKMR